MMKDVEYLTIMEMLEHEPSLRPNHPHIVPLSGLVESSIVRLQNECTTVLELWGNGMTKPTPIAQNSKKSAKETELDLVTKQLAEWGISDPTELDAHSRNALHNTCRQGGLLEAAKLLLTLPKYDVNVQDLHGDTALHGLAGRNTVSQQEIELQAEVFSKMVDCNLDIDRANENGETALLVSVMNSQEDLACRLLAKKADPFVSNG